MEKVDYVGYNADIWDHINECLADKSTAISHEEYLPLWSECPRHR